VQRYSRLAPHFLSSFAVLLYKSVSFVRGTAAAQRNSGSSSKIAGFRFSYVIRMSLRSFRPVVITFAPTFGSGVPLLPFLWIFSRWPV